MTPLFVSELPKSMGRGRATPEEAKDPFAVALGAQIRAQRERAGLTQRELSRRAKYDAVQLSRVESGEAVPRADAMLRLAVALRTPIGQLYGLPAGVSLLPDVTPPASGAGAESRLPEGPTAEAIALLQEQIDDLRAAVEQLRSQRPAASHEAPKKPRRSA